MIRQSPEYSLDQFIGDLKQEDDRKPYYLVCKYKTEFANLEKEEKVDFI